MFSVNDHIFYSTTGVCRITGIKREKFGNIDEQDYYILQPIYSKSITYVSTTNETQLAKMRPVMTRDEIYSLINNMPNEENIWLQNIHDRNDVFSEKLRTGNSNELVKLIKTLFLEGNKKRGKGKTLNINDIKILTTAEKLLHEEIAFVLGIEPDRVLAFILENVPVQG